MNTRDRQLETVRDISNEYEQQVLGILLQFPDQWDRVGTALGDEDFGSTPHRLIFQAIADCWEVGDTVDALIVCDRLDRAEKLNVVGGLTYVAGLAQAVSAPANLMHYVKRVRDAAIMRRLRAAAQQIDALAFQPGADPVQVADEAEETILKVLDREASQVETIDFADAVDQAERWLDNPTKGLTTGFPALDKLTGGLKAGELVIVAGRPSMGKSSLAMVIAEHVARTDQVVVFSLEMSSRQIGARALAYHRAQQGNDKARAYLKALRLRVNDSAAMTIGSLRLRLRRHKRQHGLALVVVDYLQLMSGPAGAENRTQEIAAISRGLKALAKDMQCCVLAVSQLSRGPENRTDHRPLLSDLRESGQVEQDADLVMMVYRDDYYTEDSPWAGIVEAIVRKNRDGQTGTVYLGWQAEFARMYHYTGALPEKESPRKSRRVGTVRADQSYGDHRA